MGLIRIECILSPFSLIFSTFVPVLKRLAPGHKDTIKYFTILGEIPILQLTSCKNIIAAQTQIDYPSFLPLLLVGIKIMTRIRTRPDYYIPCTEPFSFSEALLQHRPLPEVPPSSQDDISTLASLGFLHSLEGSGLRWTSRENLLIGCEDEDGDPQLFVALYDFQAGGENQLSLKKSEQVSCHNLTITLNEKWTIPPCVIVTCLKKCFGRLLTKALFHNLGGHRVFTATIPAIILTIQQVTDGDDEGVNQALEKGFLYHKLHHL